MVAIGDLGARQGRNRHRTFALPIYLGQARAKTLERLDRVLDIHGGAAPDERSQLSLIAVIGVLDETLQHRRRGEHGGPRPCPEQAKNLVRVEGAGLRHDMHAHAHEMRRSIETRAMAQRRGVNDRIARPDRIHFCDVGMAHHCEHAMGEHCALGPSGRARGVEQPGQIITRARLNRYRIAAQQLAILLTVDGDQVLHAGRNMRRELRVKAVRGKTNAGARMLENVTQLCAVQLGIRGNSGKPRVPDRT